LQTCSTSEFVYMLVFVHMFFFGSIFHIWEKTCHFCVSDPGLLHLTWCPPIASIYLQTKCHYSLWMSNTPLCIFATFSWFIHQLDQGFQSLAIVNSSALNIGIQVSLLYPVLSSFG
jgi:hypothetical protein